MANKSFLRIRYGAFIILDKPPENTNGLLGYLQELLAPFNKKHKQELGVKKVASSIWMIFGKDPVMAGKAARRIAPAFALRAGLINLGDNYYLSKSNIPTEITPIAYES